MLRNQIFTCCWFACIACFVCQTVSAEDVLRTDDPAILGKWTAQENTKNGPVTLVKEHAEGRSTVTAYDAARRILYAKVSDYHTEKHGNVRVFVFSNSKYTGGPDAGKTDHRTRSYVYRADAKKFYEVRGMVEGVNEPPAIIVWDRVEQPAT